MGTFPARRPRASRRDRWLTEEPHLRDLWCPPPPRPSLYQLVAAHSRGACSSTFSRITSSKQDLGSAVTAGSRMSPLSWKNMKIQEEGFVSLGYGWWGFIQTECSAPLNFPCPFKAKMCAVNETTFQMPNLEDNLLQELWLMLPQRMIIILLIHSFILLYIRFIINYVSVF